uniref:Uncharacterized protein n=1 Tax=Anguilla anguilla TaxID=7936 RepID=A0A0E9VI66_ANGAN
MASCSPAGADRSPLCICRFDHPSIRHLHFELSVRQVGVNGVPLLYGHAPDGQHGLDKEHI